jgi:hypothetical protein
MASLELFRLKVLDPFLKLQTPFKEHLLELRVLLS